MNDFEPSQINPLQYTKGQIIVELKYVAKIIEEEIRVQDCFEGMKDVEVSNYIGVIRVENIEYSEYLNPQELNFNPYNLHDFILKYSVINNDLNAGFKFTKDLTEMPKISMTSKFNNDNSVIKYFMNNLLSVTDEKC